MHEIELKAYHEAAHACLHESFSCPVKEVAISENGGHCKLADEWEWEYDPDSLAERESLLQTAICCCGGRAIYDKIRGGAPEFGSCADRNWRASEDYAQAWQGCLKLADGDKVLAGHWLALALRYAEILVEEHWSEISAVAYGLLEYGRLSGQQMREIIERTRAKQL